MDAILQRVHTHVHAGETPPALQRYRGLSRWIASAVARCVQFLARPITIEQRAFNQATFDLLQSLYDRVEKLQQAQAVLAEKFVQIDGTVEGHAERLNLVDAVVQRQVALVEECESGLDEQHTAWKEVLDRQDESRRCQDDLQSQLIPLGERVGRIQTDLLLQQRRLSTVLEQWRRSSPPPQPQPRQETAGGLDRLYAAFEDQFRGGREDIKQRMRSYLPLLKDASPILDLGCGRGEWLELLREHGHFARGVDLNEVFLEECRQRGLAVEAGDALDQLRAQPAGSLGAVTAFHLVEHLPFAVLLELLDETVRVLRPGGLALFETPNPENLLVSTYFFYADPTHRNPIFAPTLQFLAEQRGLVRVEARPMNQHLVNQMIGLSAERPTESNPVLAVLARHLTAAPDFALVGWKA